MEGRTKGLAGILLVCLLAVVVRSVPALESPNIYGFDSYVHYHFADYVAQHGRLAPFDGFKGYLVDDRAYWPGVHILAGATETVTASPLLIVFKALPPFLGTLMVLLIFLIARRLFGQQAALVGALLYAVADYAVIQSSWLAQETLGIVLLGTFILILTSLRPTERRASALLLGLVYLASLMTHHFSQAILLMTFLLAAITAHRRTDRARLGWLFVQLLPLTVAWWAVMGSRTGSFPDILRRSVGVLEHPAVLAAGIALLVALGVILYNWSMFRRRRADAFARLHELADLFDRSRATLVLAGAGAVVLAFFGLLLPTHLRFPQTGLGLQQVTKYALVFLGGVGIVALIARHDRNANMPLAMLIALGAGNALVILVLTFLPLQTRFIEFAYIPLSMFAGVGLVRLVQGKGGEDQVHGIGEGATPPARTPRRGARALAIAIMLTAVVVAGMVADDYSRVSSGLSRRYYHTDKELAAARWVRDNTEPDAIICAPFGVQPVVFAIGERMTDTVVVKRSILYGSWVSAFYEINLFSGERPTYILLTTDTTKYGELEYETYTQQQVFAASGSYYGATSYFHLEYVNNETVIFKALAALAG